MSTTIDSVMEEQSKIKLIDRIALGTVQFGLDYGVSNMEGKTSIEEVFRILNYCKRIGLNTLDTAHAYGTSEVVLGDSDQMNEFEVVTKFLPEDKDGLQSTEQILLSLERLKIKSLYGALAHRPSSILMNPDDWKKIKELKQKGLIKKIGFSFNDVKEFDSLLSNNFIPDLIQVPFNYFDQRFKDRLLSLKKQCNAEIHVRSVFLQGLFFVDPDSLPDFFDPVKDKLKQLGTLGKNKAASLLQYVLSHDFIDKVVIGVNNLNQLIEITNGLELEKNSLPPLTLSDIPERILMPSTWPAKTVN